MKIMKKKAYGSIPHLLGSKMGIGDKRITRGQHDFVMKKKRRNDFVIVQEKLDGSCVSVYSKSGIIYALTRAGYEARTSPYKQHHKFHEWVFSNIERFQNLLRDGERVVGEWILQSHGTKIDLWHEPFVAFDIFDSENKRLPYKEFAKRINLNFITPFLFSYGDIVTEERVLKYLNGVSYHGQQKIEGLIFRMETEGEVNYLAKYVRHDYEAGLYMKDEIYNNNWESVI